MTAHGKYADYIPSQSRLCPQCVRAVRVLITNIVMQSQSGTEMYVRDLAAGLLQRGHFPVVFSPHLGLAAESLRALSVPVVDRLELVAEPPDVIHGHHSMETVMAVLHFAHAPAIFVCHDAAAWHDTPPRLPRVYEYVAVDLACRERLVSQHGVAPDRVHLIQNAVDLDRFPSRGPLPEHPQRALLISNYVNAAQADEVRRACSAAHIQLDTVGQRLGGARQSPERLLGQYDLVFAKGRCAWEALAVGTAVVVCDAQGVGPLVTRREVEQLRKWNFGRRLLQQPLRADVIAAELARYDADDARQVSQHMRSVAGTERQLDRLLELYAAVIAVHARSGEIDRAEELRCAAQFVYWCAQCRGIQRDAAPPAATAPPRRKRWWRFW